MNSKKNLSKLSRAKSHRNSLKRNLLNNLVLYEHMTTTKAKSKLVLAEFDRVINIAKKEDRYLAEKQLKNILFDKSAVLKAIEVLAKRFKHSNNGFIKVYKLGRRQGDNAEMVKLMIKGYEHKDIGKVMAGKSKIKKKTSKLNKSSQTAMGTKNVNISSQVANTGMQGKSNTRSGL